MSQQINLLRPKDQSFGLAMLSLGVLAVGVLVLLGYHQVLRMETARLSDAAKAGELRLTVTRNRIAALQATKTAQGDSSALSAEIASLRPRAEAVGLLVSEVRSGSLGSPAGYTRYFDAMAGISVEGLWITSVSVAKGGTSVAIHGRAMRSDSVMQYAARLNAAFLPHGMQFKSLELFPEGLAAPGAANSGLSVVSFKLS